jgi:hypothetical protein
MDAKFDVAPFRSSGLDMPMDHTSIVASHNSAKLDPKLQHPALPLSDDLPQNTITNGGHTCSSSTDSSFVFQTLEHSRHNPSPTNAQTCLNNSESNAKPFALNPINLTDSDAIANAFLQYQAEFMTLFAHLSSTCSTSDHSVIHGFLHAQIITNTIQHHLRPIDQLINAVNNKLSQTKVEIQNSISNSHKNKFTSHTAPNLEPKIPSSMATFANVVSSSANPDSQPRGENNSLTALGRKTTNNPLPTTQILKSYPLKQRRIIVDTHGPAKLRTNYNILLDSAKKAICDTVNSSLRQAKSHASIIGIETRPNKSFNLLIQDGFSANDILTSHHHTIARSLTSLVDPPFDLLPGKKLPSIIRHGIDPAMVLQASKGLSAPVTSWEVEDFHNENPFLTRWEGIKACNSMSKFPKAPRWLTPIKDIHSNWHKDNEERKSRASIVIQAESISNISGHQTQPVQLPADTNFIPTLFIFRRRCVSSKYIDFDESIQCTTYLQYGHHAARCPPDQTWCKFYAKNHHSTQHKCLDSTCTNQTRKSCNHISSLCYNCKLPHESGSPECSVHQEQFLLMR